MDCSGDDRQRVCEAYGEVGYIVIRPCLHGGMCGYSHCFHFSTNAARRSFTQTRIHIIRFKATATSRSAYKLPDRSHWSVHISMLTEGQKASCPTSCTTCSCAVGALIQQTDRMRRQSSGLLEGYRRCEVPEFMYHCNVL